VRFDDDLGSASLAFALALALAFTLAFAFALSLAAVKAALALALSPGGTEALSFAHGVCVDLWSGVKRRC